MSGTLVGEQQMNYVCFYLRNTVTMEKAWAELESLGCQLLYSCEEFDGAKEIYGHIPVSLDCKQIKSVKKVVPANMDIDWESQWATHGFDYHDGFVHVDLKEFGYKKAKKILKLSPGPGFGDLSHPTTRMMLKLMSTAVSGKVVVDVGSGSGVLALAALFMNAKEAYGIDIDKDANEHAKKNAEANEWQDHVSFVIPQKFNQQKVGTPLCIVMNMIWSEQLEAWKALKHLYGLPGDFIVSGILATERDAYLKKIERRGWELKKEADEEGWVAMHFSMNPNNSHWESDE